jgi:hypothetical protein
MAKKVHQPRHTSQRPKFTPISSTHVLDHLRGNLSDSISQRLQVRGELDREDGRIGDSQVGRPVNLQVGTDDTTVVEGHHRTRRRRVVLGLDLSGEPSVPLGIGLNLGTGEDLAGHKVGERSSVSDLSSELETFTDQPSVGRVGQVVGVDDGVLPRVGRVQVDLTGREGVLQGGLDGDRIVTSLSSTGQTQQKLDMSDRREDEVLGTSLVNGTVSSLNGGVGRRANVLHSPSQVTGDRVPELRSVISKQVGNVGVSDGRVDKREEALGSVGQSLVDTVGSGGVSGGLEDDLGSDVIGNVLANTGKVNDGLDTDALQVGLGSDTAHHQHVRGTNGTSGQDDFLVGGDGSSGKISTGHRVLDTGGGGDATGRVGVDLEDTGVGQDVQVGPRWEGVDVGRLGVRTGPAKDGTEASFSDSVRAADWLDCLRDSPVGRVDTRSGDKGTPTVSTVRIGTDIDPNVLQDSGPLSDDR